MLEIKQEVVALLIKAGINTPLELDIPPKPEMGDFAFSCFILAKQQNKNPVQLAKELASTLQTESRKAQIIEHVEAFGPYVNFFLRGSEVAHLILKNIEQQKEKFGTHIIGKGKKYVIEFACPNPLKAFHLGHLKNLITGESVVRIFENAGYNVVRVNYQGDVGLHVAKALWGIFDWKEQFESVKNKPLKDRVEFLGRAYAHGSAHFEQNDAGKADVVRYNDIVYEDSDAAVIKVYKEARAWSLDYFNEIYKRLNSHFDKLFFESQMFKRGVELVKEGLEKGIFKKSDGAIIFAASEFGLHDRVFINSKGFPTYEAKDMALAEAHFKEFNPDKVIHVVGKEQTEYFKVIIKALEFVVPESVGKEEHLIGGFLQLKGDQKMSSRKGNIVTGDELIEEVKNRIVEIMKENLRIKKTKGANVLEKITAAALKYGMLKNAISQDVSFDLQQSLSVTGDSGPYLLYIVARIKSIFSKYGKKLVDIPTIDSIDPEEKKLILQLANFPEATKQAVTCQDPSKIAHYLLLLAQDFNTFYTNCPVLKSTGTILLLRLHLLKAVEIVMSQGLYLLGIETVEEM